MCTTWCHHCGVTNAQEYYFKLSSAHQFKTNSDKPLIGTCASSTQKCTQHRALAVVACMQNTKTKKGENGLRWEEGLEGDIILQVSLVISPIKISGVGWSRIHRNKSVVYVHNTQTTATYKDTWKDRSVLQGPVWQWQESLMKQVQSQGRQAQAADEFETLAVQTKAFKKVCFPLTTEFASKNVRGT